MGALRAPILTSSCCVRCHSERSEEPPKALGPIAEDHLFYVNQKNPLSCIH